MIKIYIKILCIFFFFSSCGGATAEDDLLTFPKSYELTGGSVLEDEFGWQVSIADKYLFLEQSSAHVDKNLYHVYDLSNLNFLGVLGKRGQGPAEFVGAQYSGQFFKKDNGDVMIWVNDAPRYRISSINISKSLRDSALMIESSVRHHPKYNFQNALFALGDQNLAGHQPGFITGTNLYPFYVLKDNSLTPIGEYPEIQGIDEVPNGRGYEGNFKRVSVAMKSDLSKYAIALRHYDKMDIYDDQGGLIRSLKNGGKFSQYNARNIIDTDPEIGLKNRIDYYKGLYSSEKFIYALYHDRNMGEQNGNLGQGVQIRVFDWNGEPKALFNCPDFLVSLAVDEERGYLYGSDKNQDRFMRYDISKFLNSYD